MRSVRLNEAWNLKGENYGTCIQVRQDAPSLSARVSYYSSPPIRRIGLKENNGVWTTLSDGGKAMEVLAWMLEMIEIDIISKSINWCTTQMRPSAYRPASRLGIRVWFEKENIYCRQWQQVTLWEVPSIGEYHPMAHVMVFVSVWISWKMDWSLGSIVNYLFRHCSRMRTQAKRILSKNLTRMVGFSDCLSQYHRGAI